MVGYVAATGQMRYAPDVRLDDYYIGCEESTLSEVAIPLHVEGQLVGVFTASHNQLDAFTKAAEMGQVAMTITISNACPV